MSQLVIRGGTVVDGTGSPGRQADVAIDGGRITAIGGRLDGERVLNADSHVVAPGFIDIHTHYDAQVFWDPCLTPSCFHGVTTVVAGNCGFSIAPTRSEHRDLIAHTLENVEDMDVSALRAGIPWDFSTFPEYLASVERHGLGLNFAAYLGHTALRLFVMGDDAYERAATPEEITRMQAVLKDGLEAGAAGFATSSAPTHFGAGGKRIPSRFAERHELEALLATLGSVGRGAAGFAPGDVPIDDLYDLQLATGVPFTYGALLTSPTGQHRRLVEVNRSGWDRGAQVWPQVSPRPLCFTMKMTEPFTLNLNPIFAELIGAPVAARVQAYADPAWRQKVLDAWAESTRMAPRWDTYVFAESVQHPEVIGRRLLDLATEQGVGPLDALLDLAAEEPELRIANFLANDDPDEVAQLLVQEHVTLGLSDAGAHVGQLCDAPQATDFLGNWVHDRGIMPIEEAVRRLTSQQADIFAMTDRGRLVPGAWADVVVFDPETVSPGPTRRTADFPAGAERLTADQPTGIRHILVNGTPTQVDGVHDFAARSGQLVKPGPRD